MLRINRIVNSYQLYFYTISSIEMSKTYAKETRGN